MIININNLKKLSNNSEYKHIFYLTSPVLVFIAKLVIEKFEIPRKNIILIPHRNTNTNIIDAQSITQESSFIDRLLKKIFLFSFQGFQLRKKLEKISNKFILYCDWDSREVLEILNSKKCVGHAYLEEGQLTLNKFKAYKFRKNRISQWKRLKRWSKNIVNKSPDSDIPHFFNECFNDMAFAFFSINEKAYPLIDNQKKYTFKDFEIIKKSYKAKVLGKRNIGIMFHPRRFGSNKWELGIKKFINLLPDKSIIKLHPAYYANQKYLEKFLKIFNKYNNKEIAVCDNFVILEAEMLYEQKNLYGPMSSLKNYAPIFGSKFIETNIYKKIK